MTKDDCANCTICRSNHLYVLDCNNDLVRTPPSIDAMSTKSVVSDSDRMLRNVTIWMWLPAFPFLLAHGIMTNQLRPVLGIIPVTFSAISGLVHVSGRARYRPANIFTAMFLLGIMIPGWVFMASNNCWHCTDEVNSSIVGTYGTVPMIINFLLHAFFVFRETFRINWRYCPHCHMDLNINVYTHEDKAMFQDSSNGKESYGPVTFVDQEHDNSSASSSKMTIVASASQYKQPRPSTDDETARLV